MRRGWRLLRLGYEIGAAVALLIVIEASLRRTSLPATCRRLALRLDLDSSTPPAGATPILPRWTRVRVRAALLVLARWPAGDTCLRRCLLIGQRLRRLDPVLRIGVRRDEAGSFGAHSWLEIGGHTLDVEAVDFATLGRVDG
jgi:Transglutaminase-like superfamily